MLGVAPAALYLVAALALYTMQGQLIYPGHRIKIREQPLPTVAGLEAFRIPTPTGKAEAWYLPPLGSAVPFPALIFAHGNGEVIDMWAEALDEFRRWGLAVMLVEYPGYGRSDGSPSEAGIRAPMVGAYDVLVARATVDRSRIVGYGQSLGGGAIAALSERRPLRVMILQSTFTSLRTFASRYWMPSFLVAMPSTTWPPWRSLQGLSSCCTVSAMSSSRTSRAWLWRAPAPEASSGSTSAATGAGCRMISPFFGIFVLSFRRAGYCDAQALTAPREVS
jgi:pimeloyl-ACP methyl ester carboxylesterase